MPVTSRLRDLVRADNAVRQIPDVDSGRGQDLHGASPVSSKPQPAEPVRDRPKTADAAYKFEPDAIARSYYVEERGQERRYYDDYLRKSLAIRTTDQTIASKREDLNTVRAIVELAEARGWRRLEVQGTTTFRREAWIEAAARGLDVRGHRPTDPDRQEADRRALQRSGSRERTGPVPTTSFTLAGTTPPLGQPASGPPSPGAANGQGADEQQSLAAHRQRLRAARVELSSDGRLVLAALGEKIDRQMARHTAEVKVELKAFVAQELVKRERAEGPVVLSSEQRRVASEPAPIQSRPDRDRAPERPSLDRSLAR